MSPGRITQLGFKVVYPENLIPKVPPKILSQVLMSFILINCFGYYWISCCISHRGEQFFSFHLCIKTEMHVITFTALLLVKWLNLLLFSNHILVCLSPSSGGHLRLHGRQGGRAVVPRRSDHIRHQEERGRVVWRSDELDHRSLPWKLRRVHHALRWLSQTCL